MQTCMLMSLKDKTYNHKDMGSNQVISLSFARRRGILVTGSHRSGSTWLGKMIALSPEVGYIHEPLNPISNRPGKFRLNLKNWYQYVEDLPADKAYQSYKQTLSFSYSISDELNYIKNWRDIARMVRDFSSFKWCSLTSKRPLLKDPFALFSVDWLSERFDLFVIILIRHPAAFVSSLKKANWHFPFDNLLVQDNLINTRLYKFSASIKDAAENDLDIVEQGILLWNIIHDTIYNYWKLFGHSESWIFLRHEDVSASPEEEYGWIYNRLGLKYTKKIKEGIRDYSTSDNYSTSGNPTDMSKARGKQQRIKRDSKANRMAWKNQLTEKEIEKIKSETHHISSCFYSDNEW